MLVAKVVRMDKKPGEFYDKEGNTNIMIKKVIRIFDKCINCPFCADKHIKEVTGYYVRHMCRKSDYKEIDREELVTFPDWCLLNDETVVDLTKSVMIMI